MIHDQQARHSLDAKVMAIQNFGLAPKALDSMVKKIPYRAGIHRKLLSVLNNIARMLRWNAICLKLRALFKKSGQWFSTG